MAPDRIASGKLSFKVISNLKVLTISHVLILGTSTSQMRANYSGGFLEGGSETTSLTMNNCIIGMLSNPEVIKKAHDELDRVIGSSRTPTFEDEPNLQYIRQIIKETLRWRPINKLGANHYATQDDWYEGMFIPKGSIIMVNWWALHYDPNRWDHPEKFDPDRMEGHTMSAAEEAASGDPLDRSHFAYGGGRRICPGIHHLAGLR
jgi:cytochrome P450